MWLRKNDKIVSINEVRAKEQIPAGVMPVALTKLNNLPVVVFNGDYRTTYLLRSSGLDAPTYEQCCKYMGIYKPMSHQIETVRFFLDHERCYCANGLGTGKTLTALFAAEFLRKAGAIRRILVVAPKSALRNAWEKTIFQTDPSIKYAILTGDRKKKIELAKNPDITYLIVNPESLTIIEKDLPMVDLVICDEATRFKTWKAVRTQALFRVALDKRIWLMSGTPAPQAPTDAYAQARILRGRNKYISFTAFRDKTMYKVSQFKWMPYKNAMDTVAKELQPCIRFSRDECLDLPDLSVIDYKVPLSKQQAKAVKSLQDACFAEIDKDGITAINAASVLSKCLQVMAGAVYGEANEEGEKKTVLVDSTDLLDTIVDIVDQNAQPVLIYTTFRSTVEVLLKRFRDEGIPADGITADTTVDQRTAIFDKIQSGELKVMVAVAQTVAHGITLTNSDTIIWVTPPTSFEVYDQANGRIYRKGQTRKCTIYRIYQDFVSHALIKRLDERTSLQNTLLQILEKNSVDIDFD